jgi:hypothetical protein
MLPLAKVTEESVLVMWRRPNFRHDSPNAGVLPSALPAGMAANKAKTPIMPVQLAKNSEINFTYFCNEPK